MLIISKRQEDHLKSKAQNINETQKLGKIFKSKVAELSWNENYRIQWDKVEIIHKEGNRIMRKLESIFIKTTKWVPNQTSLDISSIWLPVL